MATFLGHLVVRDCVEIILEKMTARDRAQLAQVDRASRSWVSRRRDYHFPPVRFCPTREAQFLHYCYRGYLFAAQTYYADQFALQVPNLRTEKCVFYQENGACLNGDCFSHFIWKALTCACRYGHLALAKWIWSLGIPMNLQAQNNYLFRVTAACGHLEIVQWLLSVHPRFSCLNLQGLCLPLPILLYLRNRHLIP